MAETPQESEVMSMLNEVFAQIGVPTIECVGLFALRLILSTAATRIINKNLPVEALKTQLLALNYESISFLGTLPAKEGFLLMT